MASGKITAFGCLLIVLALLGTSTAQRDRDEDEPTSDLRFLVIKDDNGKPVRNAAVIMHSVNSHGKQGRGDLELKTDLDGKATFEGIPYGKLRVQVLASGFQTFGEDYDVAQPKMDFTIKLKRPQSQYSVYDDHKTDKTPPDPNAKPQ
jgi:hypothetical protein